MTHHRGFAIAVGTLVWAVSSWFGFLAFSTSSATAVTIMGEGALVEIYQDLDSRLAGILRKVPENALIIVFAVHGMAPNPGWADHFADIIEAMSTGGTASRQAQPTKKGVFYSLKKKLPYHWVRPVLGMMPVALTNRLVSVWSAGMYDWSATRYFPLPMDHAGYVRINLRGRERGGIVEPGADYDRLCDDLAAMIGGLRDGATGMPIAGEIRHAWRDAPEGSEHRDLLPDLVVHWTGPRASDVRHVVCDALPGFRHELKTPLPSGRSGNHTANGWAIAAGPDVGRGSRSDCHSILDLAPTVMHRLGLPPDPSWEGAVMPLGAPPATP